MSQQAETKQGVFPEMVVMDTVSFFCGDYFDKVDECARGEFFHSDRPDEMTLLRIVGNRDKLPNPGEERKVEGKTVFECSDGSISARPYTSPKGSSHEFHLSLCSGGICAFIKNAHDFSIPREELHIRLMAEINTLHAQNQRRELREKRSA